MKLKIIISSAVELEEKKTVKETLSEMRDKLHLIKYDDDELYDCADHATIWGADSKQEEINRKILSADWFICLIPQQTVGEATWRELKLILEAHKKGAPVVISVFHPLEFPAVEDNAVVPKGRVTFDYIKQQAEVILGNKEEQYWINYQYNSREDLKKQLYEEFVKLYYTDKVFRAQHLKGVAKLGCKIKAKELYFDKNRADITNGFIENKYFPRRSVDGRLQEALDEQHKIIVLLGAPGSGKTRAMYQLLARPQQLVLADTHKQYALGALANQNVIIVHQSNVKQVYEFLKSEKDYENSSNTLSEYYLVCDQLKDVFGMLNEEQLHNFFDLVVHYGHVHIIVTSIPSAFSNFCERWNDYGRKPLEDDQLTKVITIPPISSDEEEVVMRNWMLNELYGNTPAETIGDYIPQLSTYKQEIVKRIYDKIGDLPYLPEFLSALQISETFRHDTALFLPILIMRKNIYSQDPPASRKKFHQEIVKMLNFLIANNVIWVRMPSNRNRNVQTNIKSLQESAFSLEYGMDEDEDFTFDGELFRDTPLSTTYVYGVNEIVWNELEQEDAVKRINQAETLLKDFQSTKDSVRAAKEFYRAFPTIKSLRRILPRIPRTDCHEEASEILWNFVYQKCIEMELNISDQEDMEEFLITIGMLIGQSKNFDYIKSAINIIHEKGLKPNYSIIGELYSVSQRLGKETMPEISNYVTRIRSNYGLNDDNFFSLSRKIAFFNMSFDEALKAVLESKYKMYGTDDDNRLSFQNIINTAISKIDLFSLEKLLHILAKKGETQNQWQEIFKLHELVHVKLRRPTIYMYFSAVAEQYKTAQERNHESSEKFMSERLHTLIEDYSQIIANEDIEACYFGSVEASWNFKQAHTVYQLYVEKFKKDNQRLISVILRTVHDHEFQKALNFLIEVDERLKATGGGLNTTCFNNLIKSAPNMGEALGVVPYITHLQEHTLANILTILKSKRRVKDKNAKTGIRQDPKIFYYAYSAVMRNDFIELRTSPYIIGLLYDLATTPKQERFIREVFLCNMKEQTKCEIIDYSTAISSIRIKKNYRTLTEIWDIFDTCRNHYHDKNVFINSEIYSNLMRKLHYLYKIGKLTSEQLTLQQNKLQKIIGEDSNCIIRDEYFLSSLYRFSPHKQIIDKEGNISQDFIKEMRQSRITKITPLNNIMADLKNKGFDVVWKFYEFIVKYYQENGKRRLLRPDLRTVTYLMETVTTKEEFERAEKATKSWCLDTMLHNKLYSEVYASKRKELGCNTEVLNEPEEDIAIVKNDLPQQLKRDFNQRTDNIIELVKRDIYLYDCITSTALNQYLKKICDIIDDISKDENITPNTTRKLKVATYTNVLNNLIEKYSDCLYFDALSYVYLIKLSPGWAVKRWVNELNDKKKKDIYKYDIVICAVIAQSAEVCKADIDTALDYFEFWEDIVYDIGYDPEDPTSISETTNITRYNGIDDYDGYWLTRGTHCRHEMNHYWNCLKQQNGLVDKVSLRFIKRQMEHFEQYGIPFPKHIIDFEAEINKYQDLIEI